MNTLIFIDTNIMLDFYRYPQGSAVLSILNHIDRNQSIIITGNQVEMEFKKNRQRVILDSIDLMKGPKWETFKVPVILSEAQPAQVIEKSKKEIARQSKKLKSRIEGVFRDPAKNDKVYQTLQRLFRADSKWNLTREDKIRFRIRRLAWKRFVLGYPPRKNNDTSIGDPINWEWIIHCAKEGKANVVIVSRDSDYGHIYGGEATINDWLSQEFKERVSRQRKVTLTNKLTHAFELASVNVRKREIEEENQLIDAISAGSNDIWAKWLRGHQGTLGGSEENYDRLINIVNYLLDEVDEESEGS